MAHFSQFDLLGIKSLFGAVIFSSLAVSAFLGRPLFDLVAADTGLLFQGFHPVRQLRQPLGKLRHPLGQLRHPLGQLRQFIHDESRADVQIKSLLSKGGKGTAAACVTAPWWSRRRGSNGRSPGGRSCAWCLGVGLVGTWRSRLILAKPENLKRLMSMP